MTITSYPFDNQTTTETQYSNLFRELQDSGVADSPTGTGFKVGVGSGLTVNVQAGFAVVRGHAINSTAIEPVTVGAAAASERIDRIILRLDPTANAITITVKAGTPGAGVPALTQTDTGIFELSLALVSVKPGASNILAADILDERAFMGTRNRAWATATRPASPRTGQLGYNTSTQVWEFWNGAAWANLVPSTSFAPTTHTHTSSEIQHTRTGATNQSRSVHDEIDELRDRMASVENAALGTIPASRILFASGQTLQAWAATR